jgi:hypothetical protein
VAGFEVFEARGCGVRQATVWPNAASVCGAVGFVFLEVCIKKGLTRIFRIGDDGRGGWVGEGATAAVRRYGGGAFETVEASDPEVADLNRMPCLRSAVPPT